MDKGAIKKFSIEARKVLMKSAITEAGFYGVTKDGCKKPIQKGHDFEVYETLAGTENRIYGNDIIRRVNLVKAVQAQGFDQVIEQTAYTWFNRTIAIRFMEVNDYLPTRVRVLSSEAGSNTPDIVTQSLDVDLNMTPEELEKVQTAKVNNKYDEAFRLLFIKQCNELNDILPGLFEKTDDYMELLLKLSYINDGVVRMLIDTIPEENFDVDKEGQVEIIGWMYQYYNTELKDDTFTKLKNKIKISKERIPAATQLFTPDWIVRYMVENSVGRVWIDHLRANDPMLDEKTKAEEFGWKYYLPEAKQEEAVEVQLVETRKSYKDLTPKDITCIDPCMGSGHILVYMFDVLMDIYRSEGFNERDAVFSILENNIRGLDIDRRAFQLSYFALMMKARGYNRRFFSGIETEDGKRRKIEPKVFAIEESNDINRAHLNFFGITLNGLEKTNALNQMIGLLDSLKDAKEYGSFINVDYYDWELMQRFAENYQIDGQVSFETVGIENTMYLLRELINQGSVMAEKYIVVSTNPPYMNLSSSNGKINKYVKDHYPISKSDLYSVFIEKCNNMTRKNGYQAMITQHSWMFLKSYEKLRDKLNYIDLINMIHLGARAFEEIGGEVVQTTAFVLKNSFVERFQGTYCRLVEPTSQIGKEDMFLKGINRYIAEKENFFNIPGMPVAYWVSKAVFKAYRENKPLKEYAAVKNGMSTTNNNRFVRHWSECDYIKVGMGYGNAELASISRKKWFPYNKGGEYRKWYGNVGLVVNWEYNGKEIKKAAEGATGGRIVSQDYYFKRSVSWSKVSTGQFALRIFPEGFLFDVAGPGIFAEEKMQKYCMGIINSSISKVCLQDIYPTMNYEMGQVSSFPIIIDETVFEEVVQLVNDNIRISKEDWDYFETSWDFRKHPLLPRNDVSDEKIANTFAHWENECKNRFMAVKSNEERLNKIFINLYDLRDIIDYKVSDDEITINLSDKQREIKSLLSYAVGCMFGRYSLDEKGLVYAGGSFSSESYKLFLPNEDNIISITDEEYFNYDIVKKFIEIVKCAFGNYYLEENLSFIAETLSNKTDSSREIIREYFLSEFYKNHVNMYAAGNLGKKPIYWLFDSGKQNGFKALIYLHRYNKDTVGVIRSKYLIRTQEAIQRALQNTEYIISSTTSAVDRAKATKVRDKYIKQLNEIKTYYQAISHVALQRIEIDLDDGVKANYAKFQGIEVSNEGTKKQTIDLLAKIK